jgi:uncharacterized lipoprotein
MKYLLIGVAAVMTLSGCGDRPQTMNGNRQDTTAYSGTGKPFTAPGWQPGDKASWESHLKARNQYGQNDFSRAN